jgi:hypothetical protein
MNEAAIAASRAVFRGQSTAKKLACWLIRRVRRAADAVVARTRCRPAEAMRGAERGTGEKRKSGARSSTTVFALLRIPNRSYVLERNNRSEEGKKLLRSGGQLSIWVGRTEDVVKAFQRGDVRDEAHGAV